MSSLERRAVEMVVALAVELGEEIPAEITRILGSLDCTSYPGRTWAAEHPDEDREPCCWGTVNGGPDRCTCWIAEFEVEQAEPHPPSGPQEIRVRPRMCSDCAFRPGSPERSVELTEEQLLDLPAKGEPFWCHDGMRRPARWVHPDGRTVPGSPDDYQPAQVGSVLYRADGSPGLLCAGWAALAARARLGPG